MGMAAFAAFPHADPESARLLLDMVRGCTFDDFLLAPQCSVIERRDPSAIDLSCRLTPRIQLRRPIVSANMDTVTRAPMAIVQAEEGGIGIIDRGFKPGDIQPQVREVETVKRTQHGVITDPYAISPSASLDEASTMMTRSGVGTLVVVDDDRSRRLVGILTERDMRFVARTGRRVADRMTPFDQLVVHEVRTGDHAEPLSADAAQQIMVDRKIKKLPLIDADRRLIGLMTAKDLIRQQRLPFATRDDQGRLRVGAAIGATGDYLERAAELIRVGVDVLVIDIAHGHSIVMAHALEQFWKRFADTGVELIAGNVATADGVRFLAERGAHAIKVGIGPGGGCTTRITTSFGVPQVQALVDCRVAMNFDLPLIADGGIKRHGSIAEALLFGGDTVMLGSAFAGTREAPGEIVHKSVLLPESHKSVKVPFKVLRGMASIGAIKDRLDVEDADRIELEAIGAEGTEISVPARGSARTIVREMIKHLCSSISYGGAQDLHDLRTRFWSDPRRYLIRLSESGRRESYER
jgi:IMP dehydrogenase